MNSAFKVKNTLLHKVTWIFEGSLFNKNKEINFEKKELSFTHIFSLLEFASNNGLYEH